MLALGCATLVLCSACGKPQAVDAKVSATSNTDGIAEIGSAVAGTGPADSVRRAHDARVAGDFAGLGEFIVDDHRGAVRELVQATDRLVAAEAEFRATVTRRLGHAAAMGVDRSGVGDAIGVFSRNVRVVDERIDGDRAIVTVQVADRVPLEEVTVVRREGRWLIETDPPMDGIASGMRELAEVLLAMSRRVERGDVSEATLISELAAQQAPVFRKFRSLSNGCGS